MATISIAGRDELTEVEHFYRSVGEERSLASDEAVIIARHGEAIVGAVRLVVEQGVCQLRTMQVHPDFQRQGVGSALLDRFAGLTKDRECFCLAWDHLEHFYAKIGFHKADDDDLPLLMRGRLASVRAKRLRLIALRKSRVLHE
jgi:N-acetylglutamate synthase-like GNAT family acetyltransferase